MKYSTKLETFIAAIVLIVALVLFIRIEYYAHLERAKAGYPSVPHHFKK